jgi:hypothetical protein
MPLVGQPMRTRMGPDVTEPELDGYRQRKRYPDGTVVRVFAMRTDDEAYASGWSYTFHYGTIEPDPPRTLDDGTILRYDNAHEDTKGHERHEAPEEEAEYIEFSGIVELYERFWSEIPKAPIEPS